MLVTDDYRMDGASCSPLWGQWRALCLGLVERLPWVWKGVSGFGREAYLIPIITSGLSVPTECTHGAKPVRLYVYSLVNCCQHKISKKFCVSFLFCFVYVTFR